MMEKLFLSFDLMSKSNNVLIIGINPDLVDYSSLPDVDASKISVALDLCVKELGTLGYNAEFCPIDLGETAESVVIAWLSAKKYDCIAIGAGVKISSDLLFESLVNWVHRYAPDSSICFNTNPSDTIQAVQRWI
ncbi:hypothetical protein [Kamptonema sp. UHCC 0994]|uniref:hypothetical protein n=1 Tax=Kamptonema sp. UHCC 0994 TaxID=3031329 RepID=UPI0023B8B4F5|nr:hypothetical protein [Kamptonema sp. UHCC 0994]MDF0552501.1 hypothetical protein [Kamptonema sp. UHCC 0994]